VDAARTAPQGGLDPDRQALRRGAGSRCGSGSTAGSRLRGSASEKPPRWSAESYPGRPGIGWSRVAGATEVKSEAVGAPSTPHRGRRNCCCRDGRWRQSPYGLAGGRESERHMRRDRQTRAQQRAAGTNNTALFDIVNTTTANGSLRARRDVARVVRAPLSRRAGCKPPAAAGAWFFARRSVRFAPLDTSAPGANQPQSNQPQSNQPNGACRNAVAQPRRSVRRSVCR
jgi:hypothetical protein